MRLIYATSDLNHWVPVAQAMQVQKGWEPVYWVTAPKNHTKVQKAFPSALTQGYIDAIRGELPFVNNTQQHTALDENLLSQYYPYERIALKMMDRMDPTAYAFNLGERQDLYYTLLSYWINHIETLKPDAVLFAESPHALFQYILYAVCKENAIQIIRFTPTHISGLTYLNTTIDATPLYLKEVYQTLLATDLPPSSLLTQAYLDKNRSSYEAAQPYYMKALKERPSPLKRFSDLAVKARRFFTTKTWVAYKKGSLYSLSNGIITKTDLLYYRLHALVIKRKLKKSYDALISARESKSIQIENFFGANG